MPLQIPCPCGKTLKVPDNLAGKKVKCPSCAEIVEVPASPPPPVFDPDVVFDEISSSPRPPKPASQTEIEFPPATPAGLPLAVSGGTTIVLPGGFVLPSPLRIGTLTLSATRLTESSRRLIGSRHVELLVKRIDSAEICSRGNTAFLIAGFVLLGVYGLGLLFLLLYAVMRSKYLVVRCGANVVALKVQGDQQPYQQFLEATLQQAQSAS